MQYSVGVEYALHCLVYLIDVPSKESVGIRDLAEFQGLSETFLSKVFGKLSKAGIVNSVPGVKGGYRLAKNPEDISFWDVIEAVEGPKPIFQCKNIVSNGLLYRDKCDSCESSNSSCTINLVMLEAEEHMRKYLRNKTLAWLNKELDAVLPKKTRIDTREYFIKKSSD
ncbi:Rrf2 family transcriptional regulator [Bacillus sp. YBsi01]|uniref:RrF2 family transcriptional regulator n=1 Tax=Bacillus sp. YBsi01 TaxID=3139388 RepID=UPI003138BDA4